MWPSIILNTLGSLRSETGTIIFGASLADLNLLDFLNSKSVSIDSTGVYLVSSLEMQTELLKTNYYLLLFSS